MKILVRLLIIAGLILGSWWFQGVLEEKTEQIIGDKGRFANYYLEDFEIRSHDEKGALRYVLSASRLDNYEKESLAEIKQVKIASFSPDEKWQLSADRAEYYQALERIDLFDNVQLVRHDKANNETLNLKTTQMTFFIKQEQLISDQPVSIRQGQHHMQSKGLRFDNNTGELVLKKVQGIYVR